MTVDRFLELNEIKDFKSLGSIPNKRLAKILKRYKYIEVDELFYDNPDEPEENTWIDVEGIGYGWCWMSHQGNGLRKLLRKMALGGRTKEEVYVCAVDNDIRIYLYSIGYSIIQIVVSKYRLNPFR